MNTTDKKQTLINATKRLTTLFNETKVSDIGMSNKGWDQLTLEGDSRFKHKEISYPKEAEDVRRALQFTDKNLAYLGVLNGYIVTTYKTDLEETRPIFEAHTAAQILNAYNPTMNI